MQLAPLTDRVTGWTDEGLLSAWRNMHARAELANNGHNIEYVEIGLTVDDKPTKALVVGTLTGDDTLAVIATYPWGVLPIYIIFVRRQDKDEGWQLDKFCVIPDEEESADYNDGSTDIADFERAAISVAMGQL